MSSQSQQIFITADEMTPLTEPEFLFVSEVVAVNATHLYTLRVKVDISLPVTFRYGNEFFINNPQRKSKGKHTVYPYLQQRIPPETSQ